MREISILDLSRKSRMGIDTPREVGGLSFALPGARRRPYLAEMDFFPSVCLFRMRDACSGRGHLECTTGENFRVAHGILAIGEDQWFATW